MIANKLGISPIDIRRINGLRPGDTTATGEVLETAAYQECLEKIVKELRYDEPSEPAPPGKVRGKGIAGAWKSPSMPTNAASSAIIRMNEDGTFYLSTSAHDIGQGSDTVMIQIAAEVLSVPTSRFSINTGDTNHTPYEWQTVASRSTYCAGNAVKLAAEDLRDKVIELAQIKLGVYKRDIHLEDGYVVATMHPENRVPIEEFSLGLTLPDGSGVGGPAIGVGRFVLPNNMAYDPVTSQGAKPVAFWTMGVNGAEVEVDLETGHIKVLRMLSCFDPGKAINPTLFDAQVEGGMVQALGTVLFEELKLKEGRILNKSFVDYKIPTADDMPLELQSYRVERAEETGPFGARGIAEPVMVPGAPAIANAVANAVGCRFFRMPITPDAVLKALKEKNK